MWISGNNLAVIKKEALKSYPHECCGLLLGVIGEDKEKRVIKVVPTKNDWENQRYHFNRFQGTLRDSFAINPLTFLRIQKKARQKGLQIVGVYHSHPCHPAIPSEFDRAVAWPVYSYVIVSVEKGQVKDLTSWCLNDKGIFLEEKIFVEG